MELWLPLRTVTVIEAALREMEDSLGDPAYKLGLYLGVTRAYLFAPLPFGDGTEPDSSNKPRLSAADEEDGFWNAGSAGQ